MVSHAEGPAVRAQGVSEPSVWLFAPKAERHRNG